MTPLLAAIVQKRRRATERLLDGGADPNRVHALFGTSVHAATGAGDVDLLQLLIDHGGDVNARNGKGQTPLQVIAAGRVSLDRLAQLKSLGDKLPTGFPEKLLNFTLPTAGWDACERLLKAQMARSP
jgi:ankyrin repeat protein